jgi:hypothetical protein
MDDSLVIGLWLLVILCLLFLDTWLLLLKYLSTLVTDSLSRVPEGQSLRLGRLNSKACPLPMVSYPRLIFRFSPFMVLAASQNGRFLGYWSLVIGYSLSLVS